MSGFGHYARTADELEREIYKRGLALGLDWDDQEDDTDDEPLLELAVE